MDAIEQTKLVISELQKLPMVSENIQQIINLVRYLRFPIVESVAENGFTIVRARRGDGYRTQSEVSYKTASLCKTAQRASLPNQTVFYGVLSDDERHLENARAICVAECSKLYGEGILAAGREKITSTQWRITDDIRVACIMSANSFDGVTNNKLLENTKANFLANFSGDLDVLNIAEFVEHEFSKKVQTGNESEYLLSASIANALLYSYGFEAVAYPSVKFGGQAGLNIAIRPDVVDSKLQLLNIVEQCYYQNGTNAILRQELVFDIENKVCTPINKTTDAELCTILNINKIAELKLIN